MAKKQNLHMVLKMDDIVKYLCPTQLRDLNNIAETIEKGRSADGKRPANDYYICNVDEPYAKYVEAVILRGEEEKERNLS